jgi:hypothetical protein
VVGGRSELGKNGMLKNEVYVLGKNEVYGKNELEKNVVYGTNEV